MVVKFQFHTDQDLLRIRKWGLDVFDVEELRLPEKTYIAMDEWCRETFGYPSRMGDYSINFYFFEESHRTMFVLRWS